MDDSTELSTQLRIYNSKTCSVYIIYIYNISELSHSIISQVSQVGPIKKWISVRNPSFAHHRLASFTWVGMGYQVMGFMGQLIPSFRPHFPHLDRATEAKRFTAWELRAGLVAITQQAQVLEAETSWKNHQWVRITMANLSPQNGLVSQPGIPIVLRKCAVPKIYSNHWPWLGTRWCLHHILPKIRLFPMAVHGSMDLKKSKARPSTIHEPFHLFHPFSMHQNTHVNLKQVPVSHFQYEHNHFLNRKRSPKSRHSYQSKVLARNFR